MISATKNSINWLYLHGWAIITNMIYITAVGKDKFDYAIFGF